MKLYWISPQHKQAPVCRHFAGAHGILLPEDVLYLAYIGDDGLILGLFALDDDPADPHILFMYVIKENRRQGLGTGMMKELIRSSSKAGLESLRCITSPDMEIDHFLEKSGFVLLPGPTVHSTTIRTLRYSGQYMNNIAGQATEGAFLLSEIRQTDKAILKGFLDRESLKWNSGYDESFSAAAISSGKVEALILCERITDGIVIKFLYSDKDNDAHLLQCLRALNAAICSETITHESDFTLSFALDGDTYAQLVKNLAGDETHIKKESETSIAVKLL